MSEQRGLGIGRALIEASQREAATLERGMYLHVIKHNVRARSLYEKLGFRLEDGGSNMHHRMGWGARPGAT